LYMYKGKREFFRKTIFTRRNSLVEQSPVILTNDLSNTQRLIDMYL